ncbi:MAG: EstA family serine hydrolase [Candidatus Rokuibacteriota bacterium]|nr:MAG: EstA family serine hydrolase [Candidatus Rokubacteria bacterium]
MTAIAGFCDQRFVRVREALEVNFRHHGELGAAVAIEVNGEPVVDIWAGWADEAHSRRWERDTLVAVFSVGKAMAALCTLMLAERGHLALDAPVAEYWPEFAARGKEEVTLRMLLAHRAGLPAVRRMLSDPDAYDWELMTSVLAGEEPWWPPGTAHGYHVNTFGFLAGEIVRRVSGRSFGTFFRDEVAAPLDADFHFGLAPEHDDRVAEYLFSSLSVEGTEKRQVEGDEARLMLLGRAYLNPPGLSGIGTVNTRPWRAAEIPSANGHASARAVARIYGALLAGRLVSAQTLDEAITEASAGPDLVLGRPSRFGLGFQLTQAERPLGPNPRSFGHFGAGGSLGFADPDEGISFAYVLNRSGPRWQNPRNRALLDAVYASL